MRAMTKSDRSCVGIFKCRVEDGGALVKEEVP